MGKLRNFAYIFRGDGFNKEKMTMDSGEFKATIVAVSDINDACDVAKDLLSDGVELIDLCGAFHEDGARMVSDAINGAIRVAYVDAEIPKK